MTLAYVQAIVAVYFGLVASLTGLLTAVALLLPAHTERAQRALDQSPKSTLISGVCLALVVVLALVCLNVPMPLVKFAGFCLLLLMTALATLGGAGLSRLMGRRIGEMAGARTDFGCLVRGSIAYSLAVLCPYVGWLLVGPISLLFALGAGFAAVKPAPRPLSASPHPMAEGTV